MSPRLQLLWYGSPGTDISRESRLIAGLRQLGHRVLVVRTAPASSPPPCGPALFPWQIRQGLDEFDAAIAECPPASLPACVPVIPPPASARDVVEKVRRVQSRRAIERARQSIGEKLAAAGLDPSLADSGLL